jgi:hypothetical protein
MNPCKLSARYLLPIQILCDCDKDENTIVVVRRGSDLRDATVFDLAGAKECSTI